MEPISPCKEEGDDNLCSKLGKFTDADLDKLQLGLDELEKVMSAFPGPGASTDFMISCLSNPFSHVNNHALPPQTQDHFTTRQILDDFDDFEIQMLPPTPSSFFCSQQRDNVTVANHSSKSTRTTIANEDQDLAREIKESQVMIEEMADHHHHHHQGSRSTLVLGNSNDPAEDVNIDISFDDDYVCLISDITGGSAKASFSEQHNHYSYTGGRSNLEGNYFQGVPSMTFFGGPSPSVRYFFCSQNSNGSGSENVHTHRKKRRHKGVVETEEEAACRVERTKIKNREAAARAHQRKQAHEAHLQTVLLKLRKKNGFLKNMVMFLHGHKTVDVHPQPLRRTISGPI